jgi:hypothetical protein
MIAMIPVYTDLIIRKERGIGSENLLKTSKTMAMDIIGREYMFIINFIGNDLHMAAIAFAG